MAGREIIGRRDPPLILSIRNIPPEKLYGDFGKAWRTPLFTQRGSGLATFMRRLPSRLFPPWHEPLPLSKPAGALRWRFMEKWSSGRGFVAARDARRCSGFVRAATAGSAIAARLAASRPGSGNTARLTAGTSRVWRAGSIIATGNVPTVSVTRPA